MLKRFQKVLGVGAFSSFRSPNNGVDLSKNTIIYANNGYGKSTLATILKSAHLDDPQRIIARTTLTAQQEPIVQEIVIKVENGTMNFQNSIWSYNPPAVKPKILVFDQQYVFENLFVQRVESGHKQSIHRIIIGQEGVQISEDLIKSKAEEKNLKQSLDEHKRVLETKISNTEQKDYLTISADEEPGIFAELQDIESKLKVSQEKEDLTALAKFVSLPMLDWDFSTIHEAINQNFQSIHSEARARVDEHIKNHLKNQETAEVFIRQGLEQLVDICPFCGQDQGGAQGLIRAYQDSFDQTHSQAIEKINALKTTWSSWDPSASILGINSIFDKSYSSLQKIETRLLLQVINNVPPIGFETFRQLSLAIKKQVLDTLSRKEANLNQKIENEFLDEFEKEVRKVNNQIQGANNLYQQASQLTNERLSAINADAVQSLEKRKLQLSEIRKRFSPQEMTWCKEYQQLESDYQAAGVRCRNLTDQLSKYSTEIFKKYQKGINEVLDTLAVGFRIENLEEQVDKRAKQPYAEFQIKINGLPVTLQEKEDSPCFQNTLSDGEKNTLSFAFFVTSLKQRGDLLNTIVIFDDPLSSMDDDRRTITANIIRDISKETKQLIVLTHKKDFLLLLSERLEMPQILSLKKDKARGSEIISFDIESVQKTDQQKRIESFIRYLDEDFCEAKSIQSDIRKCLESGLRFKYFRYLKEALTLGKICDDLQAQNKLSSDLLRDLRDLNEISSSVHHGELDADPTREMDRAELLPFVQKTLEVVERI
jgi:wobble nucleotide-excising tRNase